MKNVRETSCKEEKKTFKNVKKKDLGLLYKK